MKKLYNLSSMVYTLPILLIFLLSSVSFHSTSQEAFRQKKQIGETEDYIPGVITIKVKEGIGPFEAQRSNVQFGVSSLDQIAHEYSITSLSKRFRHKPISRNSGLPALDRIYKIKIPENQSIWEVIHALEGDTNIQYAEPVYLHYHTEIPNDPKYNMQQHLPQIMAEEAWEMHKGEDGASDVVVAIVDTGTDWLHPDLTENTWQNMGEDADGDGVTLEYNNGSWEMDPGDLNGIDDDGNGYTDDLIGWDLWEEATIGDGSNPNPYPHSNAHGTHCAGIAAARTNNGIGISSISYNVKYMPVKTDNGETLEYAYEGVIYAAENGADIISNSWGSTAYSHAGAEVIEYASALGSILLGSAGNNNANELRYPSSYPGMISVAAVNSDDTRASFTNYGPQVDIAAPGVSILSTVLNTNYLFYNGTSMATPMVAGLIALIKSYNSDWTNDQLINQVIGTADDIDALNPGYENMHGDGRINAFHALSDENVYVQQELRLDYLGHSYEDEDGDQIIEPGESVVLSLNMRNYAHLVNNDDVAFEISTVDKNINITTNYTTLFVNSDTEFEVEDAFEFTVSEDAVAREVIFRVNVYATCAITHGSDFFFTMLIAPSGMLVWDGIKNGEGHSGSFISQYLSEQGHDVLHTDQYPSSFAGFEAVFLSFGNGGEFVDQAIFFDSRHAPPIMEYLKGGCAKLYIDGMAVMSVPEYYEWANAYEFLELFGVTTSSAQFISNPISLLEGQEGSVMEGIEFVESNQQLNWYIDNVTPAADATVPFVEEGYGNVSVYNSGIYDQQTFYLGYSLSDLVDLDPHSSRYHVMAMVMEALGYPQPEGYVIGNFRVNQNEVLQGDEIYFSDWSVSDDMNSINSWTWDFDEDGEIDASGQYPFWSYNTPGNYDVMLIVSNNENTDTLVKKDLVMVKGGTLVYEDSPYGVDQSGMFIRDYLADNGYNVVYTNEFPQSLEGFNAVFASFGSDYPTSPSLDNSRADLIKEYLMEGGKVYLEGANVFGFDQSGNNYLRFLFGINEVDNGTTNPIEELTGHDGSIMQGMNFTSSMQANVESIDLYTPYADASVFPAFVEDDYGTVAVQYDGSALNGHKTVCMSYALANLEDGEFPSTRAEVLHRILEFFNPTTGTDETVYNEWNSISLYPNPASDRVTLSFTLENESTVEIAIYDLSGRKLVVEAEKLYVAGKNDVRLETAHLPGGTYFYKVISGDRISTGKLILTK